MIDILTLDLRRIGSATSRIAAAFGLGSLIAVAGACGGGGGGGGGGGPIGTATPPAASPVPVPSPTPAAPTPSPVPTPAGGVVYDVLLSAGDEVDGLQVDTIREARRASDGSVIAIITVEDTDSDRAVVRIVPDGETTVLVDPRTPPAELDVKTIGTLRVAGPNLALFRTGTGPDMERLFVTGTSGTRLIAGGDGSGGAIPARIVGSADVGAADVMGFVLGQSPCEPTPAGALRCEVHLFAGTPGALEDIDVDDIDLSDLPPRTPQVRVADSGAVIFSLPGAEESPTVVRYLNGGLDTILSANDELDDLAGDTIGRIVRPELEAINGNEDLLLRSAYAEVETPRPNVLGVLANGADTFAEVGTEEEETAYGKIAEIRAIALDDTGHALYLATTAGAGESGEPDENSIDILRRSDGETSVDVAVERGDAPDLDSELDLKFLELRDPEQTAAGDVSLIAVLGTITPGAGGTNTIVTVSTDVLLRQPDGSFSSLVSTLRPVGDAGDISAIRLIGDVDDEGKLLVVVATVGDADGVLVEVTPPAP